MFRDFLEILLNGKDQDQPPADYRGEWRQPKINCLLSLDIVNEEGAMEEGKLPTNNSSEQESYINIIEDMESHILKNSVLHIFESIPRMRHKIIRISHEASLLEIWKIMVDEKLKLAALESIQDPENKIPSFIQGFVTYTDYLEFFLDNYEGSTSPFECKLKDLDITYAMSRVNEGDE